MKILLLSFLFVSITANAADFTIKINSGKKEYVYRRSDNQKIGETVHLFKNIEALRISSGELLVTPASSFLYANSDCAGTPYLYGGDIPLGSLLYVRGSLKKIVSEVSASLLLHGDNQMYYSDIPGNCSESGVDPNIFLRTTISVSLPLGMPEMAAHPDYTDSVFYTSKWED